MLLFDVDGTLVTTGGAGRRAIEQAFERVHGRTEACSHFLFDGMTDRAIVRGGLLAIGVEATDARIDELLAAYVVCLEDSVRQAPAHRYVVHEGTREAVESALGRRGFAVGLGTGNIREGARVKLERVDFFRYFSFGGFGDDHETRAELIRAGAARGAAQLGVPLTEARVVIIGDTPKDIDAANAIGALSLGVGTGSWAAEALRTHGATWAFDTLADEGVYEALFESKA